MFLAVKYKNRKDSPSLRGADVIKIAVIGAHSTGKTSMCKQLKKWLEQQGLHVKLVSEIARKCPYPLNEKTSLQAQQWVFDKQVEAEKKHADCDVLICDRSVLDNYAYLHYVEGEHEEFFSNIKEHLGSYDALLVTRINHHLAIEDDGFRSMDKEFRREIQSIIYDKINNLRDLFAKHKIMVEPITCFEDVQDAVEAVMNG